MEVTKKKALDSIQQFSSQTDKKKAWTSVSESCRSIGNETIKILHIVYGAEIKRLLKNAEIARLAVESIKIQHLQENPQDFADNVSNSVSKIFQFASYLKLRANDEIAPSVKSELIRKADKLVEIGNNLIGATNDYLGSEQAETGVVDPSTERLLNQYLADMHTVIKSSEQDINEIASKNIMNLITTTSSPSNNNSNNNNNQIISNAIKERDAILDEIFKATSKAVTELLAAGYKGDSSSVRVISSSLDTLAGILSSKLKTLPAEQQQAFAQILERLLPATAKYISVIGDIVDNPGNTQMLTKVNEPLDDLQDILHQLVGAIGSREQQLLNIIRSKQDCLAILAGANDPSVIVGTLKALTRNHNKMEQLVTASDPQEISNAVKQLAVLLPQQIQVAKVYLRDLGNNEVRQQLRDINSDMCTPLAHIVSLMDPTIDNEAREAYTKEHCSSAKIIEAAKRGDARAVDALVRELEQVVSNLVSISTSETTFDPTANSAVSEVSEQLISHLAKRRGVAAQLCKNPNNQQIQMELELLNDKIGQLTLAVSESVSSDIGVLLHKLYDASRDGQLAKVEAFMKEISNKTSIPIHTVNTQESIKKDLHLYKMFNGLASDLTSFVGLLSKETKGLQPNKVNETDRLEYLGGQIKGRFNELTQQLKQHQNEQQLKRLSSISSNSNESTTSSYEDDTLTEEEPTEKKILQLFGELMQHIRKSEANKSVSTLKAMISEQEKLISKANDLMLKTMSPHFKAQIESSISLFKNSISLAISTAGKVAKSSSPVPFNATASSSEDILNKCIRTVKRSIVELGHLLKFNSHIEVVAAYLFLTGASSVSDPNVQRALRHFKEFAIHFKSTPKVTDLLSKIDHFTLSPTSLDAMFEILLLCQSIVQGASAHQTNSRYHILTAFEMEKFDSISGSIHNIVEHQTDLIKQASDYLATIQPTKLDDATRRLLAASLRTVQESLSQQVEATIMVVDRQPNALDKLITVHDVIRESVENAASAIFNAYQPQIEVEGLISQSISGFIPTLSLNTSKAISTGNNANSIQQKQLDQLVSTIVEPLEQLEVSRSAQQRNQDATQERIPALVREEKDLINKLLSYLVDTDTQGIVDTSRALVKCHHELLSVAESSAKDDVKEAIKETCHELTQLIPQQLSTIKQALQSNNDQIESQLQHKSNHIANQIKRNINLLQELTVPSFGAKLASGNFRAFGSKPLGVGEQMKQQTVQLRSTGQSAIDCASRDLPMIIDPERQQRIRDAIKDLENRLKNKANGQCLDASISSLLNQPNDKDALAQYESSKQSVQESIDNLMNELSSTSQQLLVTQQQNIHSLSIHAVRGSFNKLIESSKAILNHQQKLKQQIQKDLQQIQDPTKKHHIFVSLGEIDLLIPEIIKASKDLTFNPTDHKKRETLEMLQTKMESPISTILYELNSSRANLFDQLVKSHQSTLVKLDDAIKSNKRDDADTHLKSLEVIEGKLVTQLEKDQSSQIESVLQEQLKEVTRVSKECLQQQQQQPNAALEVEKDYRIFNLMLTVSSLVLSQSIASNAIPANTLGDSNDQIKNILNSVKSNNVLNLTKNPEKVQKYVSIQNGGVAQPLPMSPRTGSVSSSRPQSMQINQISKTKQPLKLSGSNNNNISSNNNNNNSGRLEDSVINVANKIGVNGMEQMKKISKELSQYAAHIKANERPQMIQSGRTIATLLNELCTEITNIAKTCNVPHLQTKLYQSVNALKTIGCQIKILSGVKAASDGQDPDSDSQLSSLISALGNNLQDINNCINTTNTINHNSNNGRLK
ncbi:filament-interacting protein [Heterostelium album PN500]|uniref:Filament-interacting protein n=1 Tax=Heterostelium pallidum (strain ATCC 26659 / Pp 5 / PN500) TaxID=670386 RepID=D3BUE8_HETP5|nr:filament-interacting protein [Heterostelium album PN500]EFA74736.1 filament-interacting protein [Heterostelium album PN500]|eukprot:XP_020426870.1 filament-interacting protein [Heterostelium album PN500]